MSIPFKQIPQNVRVPLFYAEVDGSHANTSQQTQRALIIGQVTAAGSATANLPQISAGPADAKAVGGPGSMLALMTAAYLANDGFGEVWYGPVSDAGGAVAATGSLTFTGTATAAGTLALYIAGVAAAVGVTSLQIPVASGTTAAQLATATAAAITAATDLPVTAIVDGGNPAKVDITARNAGLAGNDIDIRLNYYGPASNEYTPAGITVAIVPMANGSVNPTLTTLLANLQDKPFDFIVSPYTDPTSVAALTAFLADQGGRWSWQAQVYGHVFMAYRGTYANQVTFGTALNDQHTSCMGFYDSPSPNWIWAAAVAGAAAASLKADPAQPLQTVVINGVLPPPKPSQFSKSLRNTLLFDGISTFTVSSGVVAIENLITTYQKNAFGQPDSSYLEVETLFTLMAVLRALAGVVTSKYARMKLAQDGNDIPPGANIVTPSLVRADLIAQYYQLEEQGLVQNAQAFAQGLICQINPTNPNRLDVLWPGTLIDQLRVFALLAQFRLS